jgi:hypothetical protein
MKYLATIALVPFCGLQLFAADLDKNAFNLTKLDKGSFMLCVKPVVKPKDPRIEESPIKEAKKVEEVEDDQKPIYKDENGTFRHKATDGFVDWYWNAETKKWFRPPVITTPFCPTCRVR